MRSWRVELYRTAGFLGLGTEVDTFARAVGVEVDDAESVVRNLGSSVVGSEFSLLVDLVADIVADGPVPWFSFWSSRLFCASWQV